MLLEFGFLTAVDVGRGEDILIYSATLQPFLLPVPVLLTYALFRIHYAHLFNISVLLLSQGYSRLPGGKSDVGCHREL